MMDVNDFFIECNKLFDDGKYTEVIRRLDQFLAGIIDKNIQIREQILAQLLLGCCYLELAKKTKDTDEAEKLLKDADEHYQNMLRLTDQLTDEQERIEVQINAKSWLVHCYFEHIKRSKDTGKTNSLFGRAVKYNEEIWTLAKQLEDTQIRIEEQTNVLFWFGVCHFEQAIRAKDMNNAGKSFKQAAVFSKRHLRLAEQLEDKQSRIQQQIFAQFGLGRCYVGQVKRIKNKDKAEALFKKQAGKYLLAAYAQLSQLSDEAKKRIEKRIHQSLRDVDYLNGDWNSYFEKKKQETQESLFKTETSQLKDAVATVLAVLHITPIELGSIPLAHYTSPHVCHILFGIDNNETASPMRLGSSTYMNDPSEGKSLLDLLNQQDLGVENKSDSASHNAFFTCFSSRVNDLNQFRLYGKEDGVEASGCCLVFNKNRNWLKNADISATFTFRSLSETSGQNSDDLPKVDEYEKLPLYQVAYIAYKDEYIAEKKCGIWFPSQEEPKFGIRLKPVGNEGWHQFRLERLKEALEELIGFFKDKSAVSDESKDALEYIRYLFKDFAFRDEEEFRLLVIKPIDSEEIEYCKDTKSIYIPYADIRNQADEVILGTNYEKTGNQRKAEVFRYRMKQKCPDVKVSRSTLPINPPNK